LEPTVTTALDAASEIKRLAPDATRTKVQKLLYYAQGYHLAMYDAPLFDEPIEAWELGPVVREVWKADREGRPYGGGNINSNELTAIRTAVGRFGRLFAAELVALTHGEAPWRDTWNDGRGRNSAIEIEAIKAYFRTHKMLVSEPRDEDDTEGPAVVVDEFRELLDLTYDDLLALT
jgi:uncharacterized phage-associated protein